MSQATDRAWVIEGCSSVGGGGEWKPLAGIEPRSLKSCTVDLQERSNMPGISTRMWRIRNVATRDTINWPLPN